MAERYIPRFRSDKAGGYLREEADGTVTAGRFIGGVFTPYKPRYRGPRQPAFPTEPLTADK